MKRFFYFLLSFSIISACSASTATPTPAVVTTPNQVKTSTPTITVPAPTQTPLPLREIPLRYPPMDALPMNECPFASNAQIERLIGTLTQDPITIVSFQPPYYENRASILCEGRSQDNTVFLDLWFAPDGEKAQQDFDRVVGLMRSEEISVSNLGERSVWWQKGLRLEVVSGDMRLSIFLAAPIEDAANRTALIAVQAIETIAPENGFSQPKEILVPNSSIAETIYLRDFTHEGELFEACTLLQQSEYETVFGALNFPLKSGSAAGELEPFEMYDCTTDALEPGGWMYFSLVFGKTLSEMILHYRRGAMIYPANATPMQNVGDEAWYWAGADGSNLNLSVLRGNVMLVINVLRGDSYENRGKIRSLARIILDRLFEPK